jgi:hypothetical protein
MDEPTYQESVRIGWTVLWRCLGGFLALLFGVNLLVLYAIPELSRTEPSLWISLLPVGMAAIISLFVIMPVIVRAMLSKSFHGFHLRFIRDNESSPRVETTHGMSRSRS